MQTTNILRQALINFNQNPSSNQHRQCKSLVMMMTSYLNQRTPKRNQMLKQSHKKKNKHDDDDEAKNKPKPNKQSIFFLKVMPRARNSFAKHFHLVGKICNMHKSVFDATTNKQQQQKKNGINVNGKKWKKKNDNDNNNNGHKMKQN